MASPAILREIISVGAIARSNELPCLSPKTQRLHSSLRTGCATTVFVEPGEPGDTSGAAAVVAGCLAALKQNHPKATVDALVAQLMRGCDRITEESGLSWSVLDVHKIIRSSNFIPLASPQIVEATIRI